MGLTFLTGYVLGQHGKQSARLASLAGNQAGSSTGDLLDLHDRVDRLILVLDAMWSLFEDAGYTDEQLMARIEEIDMADGVADGKRTPLVAQCRECGAKIAPGLPACQFCGTALPDAPEEDPLRGI
jgi:hypothetical protein